MWFESNHAMHWPENNHVMGPVCPVTLKQNIYCCLNEKRDVWIITRSSKILFIQQGMSTQDPHARENKRDPILQSCIVNLLQQTNNGILFSFVQSVGRVYQQVFSVIWSLGPCSPVCPVRLSRILMDLFVGRKKTSLYPVITQCLVTMWTWIQWGRQWILI